jgi:hypothetical protein
VIASNIDAAFIELLSIPLSKSASLDIISSIFIPSSRRATLYYSCNPKFYKIIYNSLPVLYT